MTERASWWSITINNPTDDDRKALENPPSFVRKVKYQDEEGSEGTLHIQGAVNTTQVRFNQVKNWLKRAHIEVARDKSALLKYVEKDETAVQGTRKEFDRPYLTMAMALKKLAKVYEFDEETVGDDPVGALKRAYWRAVRIILEDEEELISLYSQPQMFRAWENTSSVWLKKIELDRQTDRQDSESSESTLPADD